MIMNDKIYLTTELFYTIPAYQDYDNAKSTWLVNEEPSYRTLTTLEKWSFLIEKLSEKITKDLPSDKVESYKTMLTNFKTKRESTSNSKFNLTLQKCVEYFEDFYFLYSTTDDRFKITPSTKKTLANSISDAVGTCETGINGRFYTILQDNKKDTNWIDNELTKARCEAITLLHAQYNATFGLDGAMDVHVKDTLVKLANKQGLGIPQQVTIWDIHASMLNQTRITDFFNKHAPTLFADYEKNMTDTLVNHYLFELNNKLAINNDQWNKGPVVLQFDQTQDIDASLKHHFQGLDLSTILPELGKLSDDFLTYTIKSKQDVAKLIKSLVTQKLIIENYYLDLDDAQPKEKFRLKKGIDINKLLSLHQNLKREDANELKAILDNHSHELSNYPELLIYQIKSNPNILSLIPQKLKQDVRFITNALKPLDELLCQAIADHDDASIHNITLTIFNLIQNEYNFLDSLSESIFENPVFARLILEKNGLLFSQLSQTCQNDPDLRELAITQNPDAALFVEQKNKHQDTLHKAHLDLLKLIPQPFKSAETLKPKVANPNELNYQRQVMNRFLRLKAFAYLLNQPQVNLAQLKKHVHHLTPDLLMDILYYRKANRLSPLPMIAREDLWAFNKELLSKQIDLNNSDQTYLSLKHHIYEQQDVQNPIDLAFNKNAVTFVTKNNNWFSAFTQYQAYQDSSEKKLERLMSTLYALSSISGDIGKILYWLTLTIVIVPVLFIIIQQYFLPVFIAAISLYLLNLRIKSSTISTIIEILWLSTILDQIALLFLIYKMWPAIYSTCVSLYSTLDGMAAVAGLAGDAFSFLFSHNKYSADSLEKTCENSIIRLDSIDEVSAHEKSAVLSDILSQINRDLSAPNQEDFKTLLTKEYPVNHHGQSHQVSFFSASAMRREHQGEFKLDKSDDTSIMRFFKCPPTTKHLLTSVEPSLIQLG